MNLAVPRSVQSNEHSEAIIPLEIQELLESTRSPRILHLLRTNDAPDDNERVALRANRETLKNYRSSLPIPDPGVASASKERQNLSDALDKAIELATRIATNAPMTNYALMHALPRIAEQPGDHGFFTEALISSIAQAAPEAKARVRAFLEGKAAKVRKD